MRLAAKRDRLRELELEVKTLEGEIDDLGLDLNYLTAAHYAVRLARILADVARVRAALCKEETIH